MFYNAPFYPRLENCDWRQLTWMNHIFAFVSEIPYYMLTTTLYLSSRLKGKIKIHNDF